MVGPTGDASGQDATSTSPSDRELEQDTLQAELDDALERLARLEQALLDADLANGRLRVEHHRLTLVEAQASRVPVLEESLHTAVALVDTLRAREAERLGRADAPGSPRE